MTTDTARPGTGNSGIRPNTTAIPENDVQRLGKATPARPEQFALNSVECKQQPSLLERWSVSCKLSDVKGVYQFFETTTGIEFGLPVD